MDLNSIRKRYMDAVNAFIDKIRDDQNVIAVIVCGSLSYDTVWEKSDVDMTVVVRDQQLRNSSYCIVEDGIILNVSLIQRSSFRRGMEKSLAGSFSHSYFSKGKIVYTTDESLYEYFEEIRQPGQRDLELSIFNAAGELIGALNKAEKWLVVKNDLKYCQYYLLRAAGTIANMEILIRGEVPTRESIQRAKELSPELIKYYYEDGMSFQWSRERLEEGIRKLDEYIEGHMDVISRPVLEFMADGEIKTLSSICEYFRGDSHFLEGILEYMSEKGVVEKVSKTIRITPKSRMAVEEVAYFDPCAMLDEYQ